MKTLFAVLGFIATSIAWTCGANAQNSGALPATSTSSGDTFAYLVVNFAKTSQFKPATKYSLAIPGAGTISNLTVGATKQGPLSPVTVTVSFTRVIPYNAIPNQNVTLVGGQIKTLTIWYGSH